MEKNITYIFIMYKTIRICMADNVGIILLFIQTAPTLFYNTIKIVKMQMYKLYCSALLEGKNSKSMRVPPKIAYFIQIFHTYYEFVDIVRGW